MFRERAGIADAPSARHRGSRYRCGTACQLLKEGSEDAVNIRPITGRDLQQLPRDFAAAKVLLLGATGMTQRYMTGRTHARVTACAVDRKEEPDRLSRHVRTIASLAIQCGRVVLLEKHLEEALVRHLLRVIDELHRLGVPLEGDDTRFARKGSGG